MRRSLVLVALKVHWADKRLPAWQTDSHARQPRPYHKLIRGEGAPPQLEVQSLEPAETGKIACRLCAALTDNFKDPNNNINRNNNYLNLDSTYVFKIDGIYELPWKLSTSVNFQHYTGFPLQPTEIFNVSNGQGVGVGESVILQPAGGQRLPSVNMLNLKLSRDFVIIWAPNGKCVALSGTAPAFPIFTLLIPLAAISLLH